MEMYAIYDRKMNLYGGIMVQHNDVTLYRELQMSLRGSGSLPEKYPEDFEVHHLGSFDNRTGEIVLAGRPVIMVTLDVVLSNGNGARP